MQAYRDEWEQKRIDTIAEFKQQAIARKQGGTVPAPKENKGGK